MRTGMFKILTSVTCLLTAVLIFLGVWWIVRNMEDMLPLQEVTVATDNEEQVKDTASFKVSEPVLVPVPLHEPAESIVENEENIDAESLDDLFREAAETILQ